MRFMKFLPLLLTLLCIACGGGSSEQNSGGGQQQQVAVTVAIPEPNDMAASRKPARQEPGILSETCPSIPAGYAPLAQASIRFLDPAGAELGRAQTDGCGHFAGRVDARASRAVVHRDGYRDLDLTVSQLNSAATLVSTIASTSSYAISVLQLINPQRLAFSISDDSTGKAVLGLQARHFEVKLNGSRVDLDAIGYSAAQAEPASVALVMDASGSMDNTVADYDSTTKLDLAYAAGHTFLDGLESGSDELGSIIFSTTVTLMNTENFNRKLRPVDRVTWVPVEYAISESGLTTDIRRQRMVLEAYIGSAIYTYQYSMDNLPVPWEWFGVAPHPESPQNLLLSAGYPWGDGTALYDGLNEGIQLLGHAANPRRIVVALTDGEDTFSRSSKAEVIAAARASHVPLYLVGLGPNDDIDEPGMREMAAASGGEYKHAAGGDLVGLFQSIQTGIRFQYVGTLESPARTGQRLELTLLVDDTRISRELLVP